jgi:hypothetical protein
VGEAVLLADGPAEQVAEAHVEAGEARAESEPIAEAATAADTGQGTAEAGADGEAPLPGSVADPLREVTVVPGVPRYHNADCILIRFMGDDDLEKVTLADAQKAGCTPCRACLPDQEVA